MFTSLGLRTGPETRMLAMLMKTGWMDEQVDGQTAEGKWTQQNKNTSLIKASVFSLLPS